MLIVVAAEHPLSDAQSLPLAALAQETLILFPRVAGPGLKRELLADRGRRAARTYQSNLPSR